jgi:hypothetical protein
MIFDKGRPITKEFCKGCKKEIKPGQKMIVSIVTPSHARQLHNRMAPVFFYTLIDNSPKYHEECYLKKVIKK